MAHEHGSHTCCCPVCGYVETVDENVRCRTRTCPHDGARLRASDTGQFRSKTDGIRASTVGGIIWPLIGATVVVVPLVIALHRANKR